MTTKDYPIRDILDALRKLHDKIDDLNAELATDDCYCLLCKSSTYNSIKGVVHRYSCPLLEARKYLVMQNEK